MTLVARTLVGALRLAGVGLALQVLGEAWDLRWHAAHPGRLEAAGTLLAAHGGIFLGVVVLLAGGAAAVAGSRQPPGGTDARLRRWLLLVLVGAAVQAVGVAWDSWRHAHGTESAVGHLLAYLGVLSALVAPVRAARLHAARTTTSHSR